MKRDGFGAFIAIAIVLLVVQVIVGTCIFLVFDEPVERGTFGDMFGVVNALFSGLALAGVIFAILLQREELRLQRKELELTREELRKSAEAQERTAQAQARTAAVMADSVEKQQGYWKKQEERAAEQLAPVLVYYSDAGSGSEFEVTFLNRGGMAKSVEIVGDDSDDIDLDPIEVIPGSESQGATGKLKIPFGDERDRGFGLEYFDQAGRPQLLWVNWHHVGRRLSTFLE